MRSDSLSLHCTSVRLVHVPLPPVWAIWVPGHTPGSTAYLVRTARGPVLLTGDASHTRWGWENDVEPGTYSYDREQAAVSFQKLRAFAAAHPNIEVRVGHQR